jgi:hypothetical protein
VVAEVATAEVVGTVSMVKWSVSCWWLTIEVGTDRQWSIIGNRCPPRRSQRVGGTVMTVEVLVLVVDAVDDVVDTVAARQVIGAAAAVQMLQPCWRRSRCSVSC